MLITTAIVVAFSSAAMATGQQTSLDISQGDIIITSNGYSVGDTNGEHNPDGYLIIQSGTGSAANSIIVTGGSHDITIDNITILASEQSAIKVNASAIVNLSIQGTNKLTGGNGFAGISVAAAWGSDGSYDAANSAQLVLSGSGSLTVIGGKATSQYGAGAGIGGDGFGDSAVHQEGGDFGQITVAGGKIFAYGGQAANYNYGAGAGIGGGGVESEWMYSGRIVINDGMIEATGGADYNGFCGAAGIGAGSSDSSSATFSDDLTIEITAGTVKAQGGTSAAGIGGSVNGASGSIEISGGNITANGGVDDVWAGAGIGGGDNGSSGSIHIGGDAKITAIAYGAAAAIGGGGCGRSTEIIIEGEADVTAYGSRYGAGIGAGGDTSGYSGVLSCGSITLNSSGTIIAYGGAYSQALGVGYGYEGAATDINSLTIGRETGLIWLFNPNDSKLGAFWGQNAEGNALTDDLVLDGAQAIWYTLPAAEAFPGMDVFTNAFASDAVAKYQWHYTMDNTISIFQDGSTLQSYQYQDGFSLGNWAIFTAETPIEQITVTYQWISSANPTDAVLPDQEIIDKGSPYIAAAAPITSEKYRFSGWYTDPKCQKLFTDGTILVDNTTLYGKWVYTGVDTTWHTITVSANEGGTVEPSGKVSVADGHSKTFAIVPQEGYKIADVLIDGQSIGAISRYTFNDITSSHTIEAVFAPDIISPDKSGISGWLNTNEHIKYLNGYPDGTFGPERNMTRAEAAQIFYNLLKDKEIGITKQFTDVDADAWYSQAVNVLASLKIITGINSDQFAPNADITRAEFVAIAMRFSHMNTGGENVFSDITKDAWYYDYVIGAVEYGWITGYSDGTFKPEQNITRSEVAVIVNRMLARNADHDFIDVYPHQLQRFADVDILHWAYYDIVEASNSHDYKKDTEREIWLEIIKQI